jgi:hypothetical protein
VTLDPFAKSRFYLVRSLFYLAALLFYLARSLFYLAGPLSISAGSLFHGAKRRAGPDGRRFRMTEQLFSY